MKTEIAIIGGGLSGLVVADLLTRAGVDWGLLEARPRLGGRILSSSLTGSGVAYDLGPAWIWPQNPRMLALARRFGAQVFEQYAEGKLVFQDQSGDVRRDLDFSTMAGALRISGGLARITDGLASGLAAERVQIGHHVERVALEGNAVLISGTSTDGAFEMAAQKVILALPPRLTASIAFVPALPTEAFATMQSVPTWMAGHAKALAVYEAPFWRDAGFSGDAISHIGPLAEIHDASPQDASEGALFGFFGLPASVRAQHRAELAGAVTRQLVQLFGPEAGTPVVLHVEDWAIAPETATKADATPPAHHPAYGLPGSLRDLMDGRVMFAGTEVGTQFGGFVEGAIEAAETAVNEVLTRV